VAVESEIKRAHQKSRRSSPRSFLKFSLRPDVYRSRLWVTCDEEEKQLYNHPTLIHRSASQIQWARSFFLHSSSMRPALSFSLPKLPFAALPDSSELLPVRCLGESKTPLGLRKFGLNDSERLF
jgi:hypothetical protein